MSLAPKYLSVNKLILKVPNALPQKVQSEVTGTSRKPSRNIPACHAPPLTVLTHGLMGGMPSGSSDIWASAKLCAHDEILATKSRGGTCPVLQSATAPTAHQGANSPSASQTARREGKICAGSLVF